MYCNQCRQEIPDASVFCLYCGEKQSPSSKNNTAPLDAKCRCIGKKQFTTKKIAIFFILPLILFALIFLCIQHERNSFESEVTNDCFTYSYLITNDEVKSVVTAKVDIQNFEYQLLCYRKNNILHQISNNVQVGDIKQGESFTYTIKKEDIASESSWLDKWWLDEAKFSALEGKIKNKDTRSKVLTQDNHDMVIINSIRYKFDSTDNCYYVDNVENEYIFSAHIFNCINGYPVQKIGQDYAGWTYGPFEDCIYLSEVFIPDTVSIIGNNAFKKCESLKNIALPNSITSIGSSAFARCTSLESITIPDSVQEIDSHCFYYCDSLKVVNLPEHLKKVGWEAFAYCENVEKIKLPSGTEIIEKMAFLGCAANIYIPITVQKIEKYAFYINYFTPSPTVHYEGTAQQWEKIFGTGDGKQVEKIHFNAKW